MKDFQDVFSCPGDITQKGYEKKRTKLLTPYIIHTPGEWLYFISQLYMWTFKKLKLKKAFQSNTNHPIGTTLMTAAP